MVGPQGAGQKQAHCKGAARVPVRTVSLLTGEKWIGRPPFHWSPVTSGMESSLKLKQGEGP